MGRTTLIYNLISCCFPHRPARGADMLGVLSNIINECCDEENAAAVALSVDALYYLCEAEVSETD